MKTSRLVWLTLIFVFFTPSAAIAQSSADASVQKLEDAVRALERRVAALEGQLRESNAPGAVAADRVTRRKLRKGISESEVERLLGSPSKVQMFGSFSVWRYGLGGEVRFDDDGTVDGRTEP